MNDLLELKEDVEKLQDYWYDRSIPYRESGEAVKQAYCWGAIEICDSIKMEIDCFIIEHKLNVKNKDMNEGVEQLIEFIDKEIQWRYDQINNKYPKDASMIDFLTTQIQTYNRVLSTITSIFGSKVVDK